MSNDLPGTTAACFRAFARAVTTKRLIFALAAASAVALLGAGRLEAQGVRYDNVALSGRGLPIAGANVAVCTIAGNTSTTPCSPLASIWSDRAETVVLANPTTTSGLGNYGFFASPGSYLVQIYGAGLTTQVYTITLPCDPSSSTACAITAGITTTGAISTGTLSVTGNISATGTVSGSNVPTAQVPSVSGAITTGDCVKWASGTSIADSGLAGCGAANAAIKPATADLVRYVTVNGNDANDCLSWGTACKTIFQAWTNLFAQNPNGGTIYVGANAACTTTAGQGLQIYGGADPSSASPPAGWVHEMPVRIVGVGTTNGFPATAHAAMVPLNCGSTTKPALQISANSVPMEFVNLLFTGIPGASLGTCISGATTCGVTTLKFENDGFAVSSNTTGQGPALLVHGTSAVSTSFELYFYNDTFANSSTGKTAGADASEAVVLDDGTGLVFFHDITLVGGSLKENNAGGSLYVDGVVTESQPDGKGAIWFPATAAGAFFNIKNVSVADALITPTPAVEVDGNGPPDVVTVEHVDGAGFDTSGPMIILGGSGNETSFSTPRASFEKQHQVGFYNGHVLGQIDAARRIFSPVAIPFANQASQLPSAWVLNPGASGTISTVTAPDGTSNAGHIAATATGQADFTPIGGVSLTLAVGDYVIGGVWARALGTTNGFQSNGGALIFTYGTCAITDISGTGAVGTSPLYISTAKLWEWYFQVGKVTTGGTCGVVVAGTYDSTHAADFFAPVLIRIPTGTISDDEAAAVGLNLASWPDGPTVGAVATLRGHPIAFGGSGDNFFATLDHTALTSNQTYTLPATAGTFAMALAGTTGSIGGSSLAANACTSGTVTISGAASSMAVEATPATYPGDGFAWYGYVSSSGTVTVKVCNRTDAAATPAASVYNVRVIQ